MYLPSQFTDNNVNRCLNLLSGNPLGMLVSGSKADPLVAHIPFLYEPGDGSSGQLIGHMAKENPQWQSMRVNNKVRVIFSGPHGYVSPQWYSAPGVPTWNYAVVHVHGRAAVIEDCAGVEKILDKLTGHFESRFLNPWKPGFSVKKTKQLLDMIVGIEIGIIHMEGKFKLSQNRTPQERERIIHELGKSDHSGDRALAGFMTAYFAEL